MVWLYYLIPIGFHLLFLPFLFWGNNQLTISVVEMVMGTIIIPIYLVIVSIKTIDEINIGKFMFFLLIMIVVSTAGIFTSYLNWGTITGNLLKPDSETVLIMQIQIIVALVIVLVGWMIACFIKSRLK